MAKRKKLTVHMIGNAHLDPVWLWHWQRGADEAIATCRSACDLLDDYPEATFSRGEGWVYEQVRQLDPKLLKRIRMHIAGGRWEVVNGWWVQSDINLPTEAALQHSIALGHAWLRKHLGVEQVEVGYNVDSFGHGPYLPRILRQAGQKYYVMMRPGPSEMELPANLFRWRSPDGHEVLTCRIAAGYGNCGPNYGLEEHIRHAIADTPDGIRHVMCFYGVGDHGGGPTRRAVEWILEHRDFSDGVELQFSTTARFFRSVARQAKTCPVVETELQMHAIGCYSVCGALKRDIREAELAASDAEDLLNRTKRQTKASQQVLNESWERICFNQFHDVLPGSSIPEAVAAARRDVGTAINLIDRLTFPVLRQEFAYTAKASLTGQRVNLVNRTRDRWRGLADSEIWFDWRAWEHHLEDARGRVIPTQVVRPASLLLEKWLNPIPRLLFPVTLKPSGYECFRIVEGAADPDAASLPGPSPQFAAADAVLENGLLQVRFSEQGIAAVRDADGHQRLQAPLALVIRKDTSDTWSHGLDRYSEEVLGTVRFGAPVLSEGGILRTTVRLDGQFGDTRFMLFVSLDRNEPVLSLRLATNYRERLTILKADIQPGKIRDRRDRVCGGWISRPTNGREHPLHHAVWLTTANGPLGVVLPDTFAINVDETAAQPTLIRNNLNAMHNCCGSPLADHPHLAERFGTDEGPQEIRLALDFGSPDEETLTARVNHYLRPPHIWDDYRAVSRLQRFE